MAFVFRKLSCQEIAAARNVLVQITVSCFWGFRSEQIFQNIISPSVVLIKTITDSNLKRTELFLLLRSHMYFWHTSLVQKDKKIVTNRLRNLCRDNLAHIIVSESVIRVKKVTYIQPMKFYFLKMITELG